MGLAAFWLETAPKRSNRLKLSGKQRVYYGRDERDREEGFRGRNGVS